MLRTIPTIAFFRNRHKLRPDWVPCNINGHTHFIILQLWYKICYHMHTLNVGIALSLALSIFCSISIWFYASEWNFINRNQSELLLWLCMRRRFFFFFFRINRNIEMYMKAPSENSAMSTKHIFRLVYTFPFDRAIPLNVSQYFFFVLTFDENVGLFVCLLVCGVNVTNQSSVFIYTHLLAHTHTHWCTQVAQIHIH